MDAPSEFEWDRDKAAANAAKHGVSFELATAVFRDLGRIEIDASRSRDGETRTKVVGRIGGALYVAVVTYRGSVCRIISARRTNATEDRLYGAHQVHPRSR